MKRPAPPLPDADSLTRRGILRVGSVGFCGLWLSRLLGVHQARAAAPRPFFGRARACILLWMTGGPPQHETWDPKPAAPAEVRGPFRPIPTSVPGVQFCEVMPRVARLAHKLCVLCGVHTDNPSHPGSSYEMLTGNLHPLGKGRDDVTASRNDWPTLASVVKRLKPAPRGVPTSVVLPEAIFNVPFYPGQDGGFLGAEWDPWRLTCDPSARDFDLPELALSADVPAPRLHDRRGLLGQVSRPAAPSLAGPAAERYQGQARQAFDLLAGPRVRRAFDLGREPPAVRDRYGRHKFCQGCLLARRLVEAGAVLVQVNWHRDANDDTPMWDFHWRLEENVKTKTPPMDQGYSALIEDLDERGLLDSTLVVWVGEFGRTPKLEYIKPHPAPGRNHWGNCFSMALAGAGVRGGQVWGSSDKDGAFPSTSAVRPADVTATLFACLGLDPASEIRDREGRPLPISRGRVLGQLF